VLYTPGVTNTPRSVERAVGNLWGTVDGLGARATWYGDPNAAVMRQPPDLLVVDEADRLKTASLEQLRDFYDRRHVGMVLIGMPGLQKRLARYAQLYSRVGFVHQFRALSGLELQGVIEHQWVQLGLDMALYEHADIAVVNAIARVTGGNFRLVQRLFAQIERILAINNPPTVTTEQASSVTQTSATLEATVNPNGGEVSECELEYGSTTFYGSSAPCTPSPGSGTAAVAVSASVALDALARVAASR